MGLWLEASIAVAIVVPALVLGAQRLGPPAPGQDPIVLEHGLPRLPASPPAPLSPALQQSIAAEARGDLAAAAAAAESAVAQDDSRDARLQAGKIAILRQRLGEAQSWLAPLVERDPSDVEARFDLALVAHQRGDLDTARSDYEQALRIHPGHADARYNLALVLRDLGDPAGARAQAEALARHHPADPRPGRLVRSLGQ